MKTNLKYLIESYKFFYDWRIKNNYFIISTGRTGTNFFAHFFNDNFKNVYALHEPKPDLFEIGMGKFRDKSIFSTKSLLKSARYNQHQILIKNSYKTYIESNPNLSFLINEINDFFPNPKFLFITRDLPSYLISAYNKSPDNSGEVFFYSEEDPRNRITPHDLKDEKYMRLWKHFSREEKIAWYWQATNSYIFNQLKGLNYMCVKYEDVFFNDRNEIVIKDIMQFFDLQVDNEKLKSLKSMLGQKRNTNSTKLIKSFDEFDEGLKSNIIKITEKMRKQLNYI